MSLRKNRSMSGYLNMRPDRSNFEMLSVSDISKKDTELWMILERFSEVSEVRAAFLKQLGIQNGNKRRMVSKNFQSFIRQAKNYYFAAKKLPNSSSALLYYYSFLNLVKAYLILYYPDQLSGRIGHGIGCPEKRSSDFKKEHVSMNDGVFKILYEHETEESLAKGTPFSINTLLGYCSDISYQYLVGGFGKLLSARGFLTVFIDKTRSVAWGTLAISNFDHIEKCKKRINRFRNSFEEVDFPKMEAKDILGIQPTEKRGYRFFEGNEKATAGQSIPTEEIIKELRNATKGFLIPNHYSESSTDFYLAHPYKIGNQFLMNEFLAIYLIMYYLSSLVRYYPFYLDKILDKKESWLINGFIESCPETFLLYIVSKITQKNYAFIQK